MLFVFSNDHLTSDKKPDGNNDTDKSPDEFVEFGRIKVKPVNV